MRIALRVVDVIPVNIVPPEFSHLGPLVEDSQAEKNPTPDTSTETPKNPMNSLLKSKSSFRAAILAGSIAALFIPAKGMATDFFWTGAFSSNQFENGNWLGGTPAGSPPGFGFNPWIFGSDAVNPTMVMNFTNANSGIVVNSGIGFDMTFNGPGTIKMINSIELSTAAHDLTINAPLAWLFGGITLNVGPSRTLTVNGGLTSDPGFGVLANNLVKSGAGTAVLASAATTILDTTISGGTLQIASAATINGGNYSGAISIATGASLLYSSSADQTLSGIITGHGSITMSGSGTLTLTQATNGYPVHLFDGAITINSGTLVAADVSFGLNFTSSITVNGGILNVQTAPSEQGNLYLNGGTVTSTGLADATYGNILLSQNSTAVHAGGAAVSTISVNQVNLWGTNSVDVGAGSTLNITSVVAEYGPASLNKTGAGTLVLSGANTYTGTTTVNAGTLAVTGSLSATSGVTVNNGGTMLVNNNVNNIINSSGAATVAVADGTLAIGNSVSGKTQAYASLALSGTGTGAVLDFGSGGSNTLQFTSAGTFTGTLKIFNWTGNQVSGLTDNGGATQDRLLFGSATGWSGTQLGSISFYSDSGTPGGFLGTGAEISYAGGYEIVPVPEPATTALIGSLALCALIGYRERNRLVRIARRSGKV